MKFLLSLLLAVSFANASEVETPQPALHFGGSLTAHVSRASPQSVLAADVLVLDSFSNATTYTTTAGSPRTFMGMPFNLDAAGGSDPAITKVVVYLAYTGSAAQAYNSIRVQFQLWDTWSSGGNPVFSNAAGSVLVADVPGPITLNPNTYSPITVTLGSPVSLSGLTGHGIVINFQGDTGAGLASSDNLTSLLRYGTNAVAVGANALTGYGYRNATGRTDFNFAPSDARSFGQTNEATAVQLYATAPLLAQSITNFVATPASPVLGDGTFTVSATGGASGNPVIFSIDPASASVCAAGGTNGATISILAAGTCTVLANQAGNASYSAAPQQSLPVTIGTPASPLVQDGGFEAGVVPTYWTQTSTNFGTPICDASCGGVGPRTGTFWAWFGGAGTAAEAGSLEQVGTIATGPKNLTFYVWWSSSVSAPPDPSAYFNVKIDGNTIFTLTPATASAYNAGYTLAVVDISAYADGAGHTLRFESNNAAAAGSTNIHLDDINIVSIQTQSITNFAATPVGPVYGDGSFAVSATGGASGNPVTFSVDPASAGVCAAGGTNGATISILSAGLCTVLADQAGNSGYSAAPQQSLGVTIAKAPSSLALSSACMLTFVESQPFTFAGAVSGVNGVAGDVTFGDGNGNTLCGSVALSGGTAECTSSVLATIGGVPTIYNLTANYSGDSNHEASAAATPLTVTVLGLADVLFREGFEDVNALTCPIQ